MKSPYSIYCNGSSYPSAKFTEEALAMSFMNRLRVNDFRRHGVFDAIMKDGSGAVVMSVHCEHPSAAKAFRGSVRAKKLANKA